ncbi:hydroxymyristoyl-ACP dehydratase [Algoriphagus sp.]|uniref:hydroxymyristoyl-ACP dehydratase n=1 Tax=Algoriphagus sp. TaxID=1872435 RepID=UPI003F6FE7B5
MKQSVLDQTLDISIHLQGESESVLVVKIQAVSPVFEGHFPSNPILPGVIMVEAVRASLGRLFQKEFQLKTALNIKFLAVLNPLEYQEVQLTIQHSEEGEGLKVDANLTSGNTVFFKMKGIYQRI